MWELILKVFVTQLLCLILAIVVAAMLFVIDDMVEYIKENRK